MKRVRDELHLSATSIDPNADFKYKLLKSND